MENECENGILKNPNAFPSNNNIDKYMGMTLRDYFANSAMQGMIGNSNSAAINALAELDKPYEFIAKQCYELAYAMLRERNKQ